jgi:type IV pilus assembly protein PilC
MASLVRRFFKILEVLGIVANTCGNVVMEKAIRVSMTDIEKGDGISNALSKHPVFPTMIIRMMSAGEQTGKIDSMLERIADFLDEEIETTLAGLTSLIEPLLIVFLGVVVGGIVICMFLPIFKMSEIINPPGRR